MNKKSKKFPGLRAAAFAVIALVATGCATNPVTGKRELRIVSEAQELQIGQQNYAPMRQSQGGDYRLDPALQTYVDQVGQRLAATSDRQLPYEFTVLNNSVPNAWALPGGKIAINRGLLTELNSEAELAAVLGHEIVHAAAGHSAQQMSRGMLLQGGILATAIAANDSDYANIWMAGANVGAQLISQRYGRKAELESDLYGMQYMSEAGYDPQGAVDLQQTFVRLSEGRRSDWLSGLFASHPPSEARVAANRQTAANLPAGGERGADQFRSVMRKTIKAKPAYDAYDEGRKALAEGNSKLAAQKANEAVRAAPSEGHFHALLGDIDFKNKKYSNATKHYTDAIGRNDAFFYYYLQRGLIAEKQKADDSAKVDLEASIKLLPTGPAYYGLGNIALRENQVDQAKEYYKVASGAGGELGKAALVSLMRLDLGNNPEQYLQKRTGLDEQGQLLVQIANPTAVDISGIGLTIQYIAGDGRTRQVNRNLRGTVQAGQSARIATELGPFTATNQYQVTISRAAIAE